MQKAFSAEFDTTVRADITFQYMWIISQKLGKHASKEDFKAVQVVWGTLALRMFLNYNSHQP